MIEVLQEHPELYKRGSKGEIRVWKMLEGYDFDCGAHCVVSGILDGTMTTSGWTITEPKNVGRSNATTSEEQASSEIANLYAIKLERGYFLSVDDVDKVAFTKPMLATEWTKRLAKIAEDVAEGVFAQAKLDGIRCIARCDGLWTRTGKPITSMPHIWQALELRFEDDPDLILDGELYNHDLKDDFNTITSIVRKAKAKPKDIERARDLVEYHIYDMPSHPGVFSERNEAIVALLKLTANHPYIKGVPTVFADTFEKLDELDGHWVGLGYEGMMVRLNGVYENKRSNFLIKRKTFITEEFPVLAMEEGKGNWSGCVKRFVVQLPNGNTCEATPKGTKENLKALLDSGKTPDWATVRHFGYTPDGKLRFPIAVDYGYGDRTD